jgi:hypothetical protein
MSDKDQAVTLAERISELATSSAMTWHEAFNLVLGAAGLLDAARERDRLRAAVDAALALHTQTYCDHNGRCTNNDPHRVCDCCHDLWPCATVRALAPVADPDPHTTSDEEQQ